MNFRYCPTCNKATPHKKSRCLKCNNGKTSKSKKLLLISGLSVIGFLIVSAPFILEINQLDSERAVKMKESWAALENLDKPLAETPGLGCLELLRESLLDPRSAYLVDEQVKEGRVYIEYRAKNAMGGFIPGYESCPMRGPTITEGDRMHYLLEKVKQ